MNQSFRDFAAQMQSCAVAADEPFQTQESVTMQFDRDALEAVVEQAQAVVDAGSSILEVLPPGCTVTAEVDYFTPAVANITYRAQHARFPVLPIGSDVIALSVALDDLADAAEELEV